jgi:hypothetical protein
MQVREVGSGAAKREAHEGLRGTARRREIDQVLVWRLEFGLRRHAIMVAVAGWPICGPMDITEDLRQDLLARWKALFDRMSLLAEAAGRGLRTLYATGDRFGLKAYTPGKFPAGGRTSMTRSLGATTGCTYSTRPDVLFTWPCAIPSIKSTGKECTRTAVRKPSIPSSA